MGNSANGAEFAPGDLLFFKRRIVHALPSILEGPVVFFAVDTPTTRPQGHHLRESRRWHAGELYPWPGTTVLMEWLYLFPSNASNLVALQMFLQYSPTARSEENLPMRAAL